MALQSNGERTFPRWRHAYVLLVSLELGKPSPWFGPDDFNELHLRIETLVVLMALVPRNELEKLEVVVNYLSKYSLDRVPDLGAIRSEIRQLLADSKPTDQFDNSFRQAIAAVTRKSISVTTGNVISSVVSGNNPDDGRNCGLGMGIWFTQLNQPAWTHVRLFVSDELDVPIDEVFVEVFAVPDQDLEVGSDGTSQRMRRGSEHINGETNAVIDAATMIARTNSLCIVVGEPGIGKSTLVQWLARGVVTGRIPDFAAAIVVKLGSFAIALGEDPEVTLVEYFFNNFNTRLTDWSGAAVWLRRAGEEGTPYLLLLDGWDEVPPDQRDAVQAKIDFERPYFTTVITSRPSGIPKRLATGRKGEVYHIAGLTRDGRRTITERYLNATQRQALYPDLIKQIENNRNIEDLACNPFMLSLLVRAIAAGKTATSDWTMAEVYELAVSWIVDETQNRPQTEMLALGRALPKLGQFSYRLLFGTPTPSYVFPEYELLHDLGDDQAVAVQSSRLVSRVNSLGNWFAFTHATFQEYFAARHFDTLGESEIHELLEQAFMSASRNIVLEFLVGMNSEAGHLCQARLDQWLTERDHYNQVLYRIAQLLVACPPAFRPASIVQTVREGLWEQIAGKGELSIIQRCATLYARLDPIGLCQDIRNHPDPNELVLGTILTSIPPRVAQEERIFEIMAPPQREQLKAGLVERWSQEKIEANRRIISDQTGNHVELQQALTFAATVRDTDSALEIRNLLQMPDLPETLQKESSRTLGQIGGSAATRILVDIVSEDIPCSHIAKGLARRALTHANGGGKRLDSMGRDKLLRRIACLSPEYTPLILSALQGYPIRFGKALLKHLALSSTVPESVRIQYLDAIEMLLTDVEVDGLIKQIDHQSVDMESWLLALAVQRRRPVPMGWLENRFRIAESPRDKQKLLTVAIITSNYDTHGGRTASSLLQESMAEALAGEDARANDLANYYRSVLENLAVNHTHPPDWIDIELSRRILHQFVAHEQDVSPDQVMLAATLLGYVSTPTSAELLRECLQFCSEFMRQPLHEMQVALLNEIVGTLARSLANLAPEWLLEFQRDLQPVDDVLCTLSERHGWLVFDYHILDAEGQRVLALRQMLDEESLKMAKVDETSPPSPNDTLADYKIDEQPWYMQGNTPETIHVDSKRVKAHVTIDFVLVTATERELKAVLRLLTPLQGESAIWEVALRGVYYVGLFGIHNVAVTKCVTMGDGRAGGASRTTTKAIENWNPFAVIMVGIAFGSNSSKQKIGDVLVSEQVAYYGTYAIRENGRRERRGPIVPCSEMLLDKFQNALHWTFMRPDGYKCEARFGQLVSGPVLVDNETFKRELLADYPTAIGGEMEAAGIMEAANELKVDGIAVKSICDWGEGKTDSHQVLAAAAAASLVCFVLSKPSATDGLKRRKPLRKAASARGTKIPATSNPAQPQAKPTNQNSPTKRGPWKFPEPNQCFWGREDVLLQLHTALQNNKSKRSAPPALWGLGGVGKSNTALKYADLHQNEYRAGFWIPAETEANLVSSFSKIAHNLDLTEKDEANQSKVITAVQRWLEQKDQWLLIFDNVEDFELIQRFLPNHKSKSGHVIYTTRLTAINQYAQKIQINSLSASDGAHLVLLRAFGSELAEPSEWSAATALSEALGGLPLALEQAGAYIEEHHVSVKEYLETYRKSGVQFLDIHQSKGANVHDPVARTFSLAFSTLAQKHPAAADLLHLSSLLAPDDIPEVIFTTTPSLFGSPLEAAASEKELWFNLMAVACRSSILKRDPENQSLSIHRLVQEVFRNMLEPDEVRDFFRLAIKALDKASPSVSFENWPMCARLVPHTNAALDLAEKYNVVTCELGRLCCQSGYFLTRTAQYEESERLLKKSQSILESLPATDSERDVFLSQTLNNLGYLYQQQGKMDRVKPLYEQALEIRRRIWGENHLETANSYNNLAMLHQDLGEYAEAEPLHQKAYALRASLKGPDSPVAIQSIYNLSELYHAQGEYIQAELGYKKTLEVFRKSYTPGYQFIGFPLKSLAKLYMDTGDLLKAKPLFEEALVIFDASMGPNHPETIKVRANYEHLQQLLREKRPRT